MYQHVCKLVMEILRRYGFVSVFILFSRRKASAASGIICTYVFDLYNCLYLFCVFNNIILYYIQYPYNCKNEIRVKIRLCYKLIYITPVTYCQNYTQLTNCWAIKIKGYVYRYHKLLIGCIPFNIDKQLIFLKKR